MTLNWRVLMRKTLILCMLCFSAFVGFRIWSDLAWQECDNMAPAHGPSTLAVWFAVVKLVAEPLTLIRRQLKTNTALISSACRRHAKARWVSASGPLTNEQLGISAWFTLMARDGHDPLLRSFNQRFWVLSGSPNNMAGWRIHRSYGWFPRVSGIQKWLVFQPANC